MQWYRSRAEPISPVITVFACLITTEKNLETPTVNVDSFGALARTKANKSDESEGEKEESTKKSVRHATKKKLNTCELALVQILTSNMFQKKKKKKNGLGTQEGPRNFH